MNAVIDWQCGHERRNAAIGAAMALLLASTAVAAPVVVETGGIYAGVLGLSVDAVQYDVTFRYGSYRDNFATASPTFLNNPSGAFDASLALQSVMNTVPYRSIWSSQPYYSSAYFVPYDRAYDSSREYWQIGFYFLWGDPDYLFSRAIDITPTYAGYQETYNEPNYQWAVFNPAGSGILPPPPGGIPEPNTLALVIAAILSGALARRSGKVSVAP